MFNSIYCITFWFFLFVYTAAVISNSVVFNIKLQIFVEIDINDND